MATRNLEQKIYPLANYLAGKNIGEYLERSHKIYISEFIENPVVLASWSDALRQIKNRETVYKVNNFPNTSELCQLFFYTLDYYWSNHKKEEFDFILKVIIEGFLKFSKHNEIDSDYIITSLKELDVKNEYIDHLQAVIRSRKELPHESENQSISQTPPITGYSEYFRLISLHIVDHKNIKNIEIDFTTKRGITVLIGNNGCGKSNIIEALSSIFAGLYRNRVHKPNFSYDITYQINRHLVFIKLQKGNYTIEVDDKNVTKEVFEEKKNDYLPKNVIACYSGESGRLFEKYFWLYYKDYIDAVKKADRIPELPLLYINKYSWSLALLTLFFYDFSEFTEISNFCNETLKIKTIQKVTLSLDIKNISKWKENSVITMVKKLADVEDFSALPSENIELNIESIKKRLSYMTEKEFFETMYAAVMPKNDKIIKDIKLDIVLNNGEDSNIGIDDLSEGERKYLLMRVILEVIGDENSLLLFDEPDAHIHISRKEELKKLLSKFSHRENIVTTHSPTLAMCFDDCNIESLGKNERGDIIRIERSKQQLISHLTNGLWNAQEQNMFLASNKNVILLVEGKTDKQHIEEAYNHLKKDYPELDFDIFYMNGETFIRQTIIGLSNSEITWDKKVIGIFDNDEAGRKAIKDGFKSEDKYYRVNYNNNPSDSFFALLLPKPTEHREDFTIENCYNSVKYEEAYIAATEAKKGYFNGLSIEKIADDIKNKSKTIMADNAATYKSDDFKGFKSLFDIIKTISDI